MGSSRTAKDASIGPEAAESSSVFAGIVSRLAGLTPDQYIAPSAKPEDGATIVGIANDHMRRVMTLVAMLTQEHNDMVPEVRRMRRQIEQAFTGTGSILDFARKIFSSGVDTDLVNRCEEAEAKLNLKLTEQKLVSSLFWLEVKSLFANELRGKPVIAIYDDWSIGRTEFDAEENFGRMILGEIVGDLFSADDLPEDAREALAAIFGRQHRPRRETAH